MIVDIAYETGRHPLVGRFADDLRIDTETGSRQLATLLYPGRAVFLWLTGEPLPSEVAAALADRASRVEVVTGRADGDLTGLLVRPDGYVAWAASDQPADQTAEEVVAALRYWLGATAGESAGEKGTRPGKTGQHVTQPDEPVTQTGG